MVLLSREVATKPLPLAESDAVKPDQKLEALVVNNLLNVLQQLNSLALHASSIFEALHQEASVTTKRISSLSTRISQLDPLAEQKFAWQQSQPASAFYDAKFTSYRRNDAVSHSLFRPETRPAALHQRRACADPLPPVQVLNKFSDGDCRAKISNPGFFVEEWMKAEEEKQKVMEEERKLRKGRKKKKRASQRKLPVEVQAVRVKKFNALGSEFDTQDVANTSMASSAGGGTTSGDSSAASSAFTTPVRQSTTFSRVKTLVPNQLEDFADPEAEVDALPLSTSPRTPGTDFYSSADFSPSPSAMASGAMAAPSTPPAVPPFPTLATPLPPTPPPVPQYTPHHTPPPVPSPYRPAHPASPPASSPPRVPPPPIPPPVPSVAIPAAPAVPPPPPVSVAPLIMVTAPEPTSEPSSSASGGVSPSEQPGGSKLPAVDASRMNLMDAIKSAGGKNLRKVEVVNERRLSARGGLMEEIRQRNFNLRKVDATTVAKKPASSTGGIVMDILARRQAIVGSDEESGTETDDDEWK